MSTAPPEPPPQVVVVERRGNGMAVAGFVCAVVGAVALGVSLLSALVLLVLGVVFGAIGRRTARREPARGGRGLATAALVVGTIALALVAALVAYVTTG